jgi:5-methylcytosine-specific restriction endonuclease McrA
VIVDSIYTTQKWRKLRVRILERDGWRCRVQLPGCLGRATEVDHITPLDAGGDPYDPSNLRAACSRCNRRMGSRYTNTQRAAALRVLKGQGNTLDPCVGHRGVYPGDLPVGGRCGRCGAVGPSRRW